MLVLRTPFGSRLYGTNTEASDSDFLEVFVPTLHEMMQNNVRKVTRICTNKDTKNSSNDVDVVSYTLHHFIELLIAGDSNALDAAISNQLVGEVSLLTLLKDRGLLCNTGYLKIFDSVYDKLVGIKETQLQIADAIKQIDSGKVQLDIKGYITVAGKSYAPVHGNFTQVKTALQKRFNKSRLPIEYSGKLAYQGVRALLSAINLNNGGMLPFDAATAKVLIDLKTDKSDPITTLKSYKLIRDEIEEIETDPAYAERLRSYCESQYKLMTFDF